MIFDQAYMDHRMHIAWRREYVATAIIQALGWGMTRSVKTALDLGCATGDLVAGLLDAGVEAWGVDSSRAAGGMIPAERFLRGDIRLQSDEWLKVPQTSDCPESADLVILLEVLSVVDPDDRAPILRNAMACGRTLLVNHIGAVGNKILEDAGWTFDSPATTQLQTTLEPWGKRQAVKALYDTGEFWKSPAPGDSSRHRPATPGP